MSFTVVHQLNKRLYDNVSISANSSSDAVNIDSFSLYAIQHKWTGATGTWSIIIEGTNEQLNPADSDYTTIDVTNVTTSSGNRLVNVEKAGYSLVRVRISYSSGGGTLKSTINAKVL